MRSELAGDSDGDDTGAPAATAPVRHSAAAFAGAKRKPASANLKRKRIAKTSSRTARGSTRVNEPVDFGDDDAFDAALSSFEVDGDDEEANNTAQKTRGKIFSDAVSWCENKDGDRVFVLAGGAGVGKSVVAAVACERYEESATRFGVREGCGAWASEAIFEGC